jgi:type I pantothenate kinase
MPTIADLADALLAMRGDRYVFLVGLTGSVAAGKTTLAGALAAHWEAQGLAVDTVSTDGFLRPNADLDAAGLTARKGFPETYDHAAMSDALWAVRGGLTRFPGYSHVTYDIDPALARDVDAPDVLIVEGLGFSPATPVDALVYLDADEADLEAWYRRRFLDLWSAGRNDPASFYHRFRSFDAWGAAGLAGAVWAQVNLPNLREHIAPLRAASRLVVRKGADHGLESLSSPGASSV